GTYAEALRITGKNPGPGATEAERILLEADPAAPGGSVVLGSPGPACSQGTLIELSASQFITIRGLTLTGASGPAISLLGGNKQRNTAIHIERNRILGKRAGSCGGGILIGKGNTDTLVVNNLIYGNGQYGVAFSKGVGGPHYVVSNTIDGNGQ